MYAPATARSPALVTDTPYCQDNKVLPTTLGAAQARAEKKWWYDPRYVEL